MTAVVRISATSKSARKQLAGFVKRHPTWHDSKNGLAWYDDDADLLSPGPYKSPSPGLALEVANGQDLLPAAKADDWPATRASCPKEVYDLTGRVATTRVPVSEDSETGPAAKSAEQMATLVKEAIARVRKTNDSIFNAITAYRPAWVDAMMDLATALNKARKACKSDKDFGAWLTKYQIDLNATERSALLRFGSNLKLARKVFDQASPSISVELIWKKNRDQFQLEAPKGNSEPTPRSSKPAPKAKVEVEEEAEEAEAPPAKIDYHESLRHLQDEIAATLEAMPGQKKAMLRDLRAFLDKFDA